MTTKKGSGCIMSYRDSFDIVAFRSRSHALKFSKLLKDAGYSNYIVSTPKEVSVGCGLSVKFASNVTPYAIKLYNINRYPISGFYHIQKIGNITEITRMPV